jgi:hypothetical protein
MTAHELVRREAAVVPLLPRAGAVHDRARLLRALHEYSAATVAEACRRGAAQPSPAEIRAARAWLDRPVFICGHHRSGTTLLHGLLDGHPQLLVLPSEATYFGSFGYVARARVDAGALQRFCAQWVERLVDPNYPPHFRLGRSSEQAQPYVDLVRAIAGWHAALRARGESTLAGLLALAAAYHQVTRTPVEPRAWVEKTPLNERFARRLLQAEHARVIQLVRDPRDTFASLRELHARAGLRFDAARHARAIGDSLRLARHHPRALGSRYLVLRYEDLASAPATLMQRVRGFLDIEDSHGLQVATAGGVAVRPNTAFDAGTPGIVRRPRASRPLAAAEMALLRAYAARSAGHWNYPLDPPSWRDHVRGWRHRLLP